MVHTFTTYQYYCTYCYQVYYCAELQSFSESLLIVSNLISLNPNNNQIPHESFTCTSHQRDPLILLFISNSNAILFFHMHLVSILKVLCLILSPFILYTHTHARSQSFYFLSTLQLSFIHLSSSLHGFLSFPTFDPTSPFKQCSVATFTWLLAKLQVQLHELLRRI